MMCAANVGPFLDFRLPLAVYIALLTIVAVANAFAFNALLLPGRWRIRIFLVAFICLAPYAPDFHGALLSFEASAPTLFVSGAWFAQGLLATVVLFLGRAIANIGEGKLRRSAIAAIGGNIVLPAFGLLAAFAGAQWMFPAGYVAPFPPARRASPANCPEWIVVDPQLDDASRATMAEDPELLSQKLLSPVFTAALTRLTHCGAAIPARILLPETTVFVEDAHWKSLGRVVAAAWEDVLSSSQTKRGLELWVGIGDGMKSRTLKMHLAPDAAEPDIEALPVKSGLVPIFENGWLSDHSAELLEVQSESSESRWPSDEIPTIELEANASTSVRSLLQARIKPRTCYELLDMTKWYAGRKDSLVIGQTNHSSFRRTGLISGAFDAATLQLASLMRQRLLIAGNWGNSGLFLPPGTDSVIGWISHDVAVVRFRSSSPDDGSP